MSLHAAERRRLEELPLPVDLSRVRIHRTGGSGIATWARRVVLRLSRGRAIALGNHVFLPARCDGDLAVLAHELTHCAQYQSWGPWRYFSQGVAAQCRELLHRRIGLCESPYAYRLEDGKPFDAYGMEQQGQIVEDAFRGSPGARSLTASHCARAL